MCALRDRFSLQFPGESGQRFNFSDSNLHAVFVVVAQERVHDPVELFDGDRRVATLRHRPEGVWQLRR